MREQCTTLADSLESEQIKAMSITFPIVEADLGLMEIQEAINKAHNILEPSDNGKISPHSLPVSALATLNENILPKKAKVPSIGWKGH